MLLNHVKSETESESVINNPRNESIGIVSMGEDTCDNYYSYRKRQLGFLETMIFLMDMEEIFQ